MILMWSLVCLLLLYLFNLCSKGKGKGKRKLRNLAHTKKIDFCLLYLMNINKAISDTTDVYYYMFKFSSKALKCSETIYCTNCPFGSGYKKNKW